LNTHEAVSPFRGCFFRFDLSLTTLCGGGNLPTRIPHPFFGHTTENGGIALKQRAQYAVIGAAAGLANGLFGAGGGLFLVPLFIGWIGMPQKHAFATSVAVIVPLSLVSLLVIAARDGLPFTIAWPYLVGGALGGVVSGWLFRKASVTFLHRAFGLLLIYGGIRAVLLL
jgi:uncharacterized membrane protein YfcA